MKIFKAIAFVLLAVTLSSCEKQVGKGVDTGSTYSYTVTFNVDGVAKSAGLTVGTIYASLNSMQIIAQVGTSEVLNLSLDNVKVGTFDLATTPGALLTYGTDSTYANTFLGTTGSITISTLTSDTITGTFNFTATATSGSKTKVISGGTFKVKYIRI